MTLPDAFLDHDKPEAMYATAGLDASAIVATVLQVLERTSAKRAIGDAAQ